MTNKFMRHYYLSTIGMYVVLLILTLQIVDCKLPRKFNLTRPGPQYDNPNFIRDRYHGEIWKPMLNESWINRFRKPFNPVWMDYCDPYHCNQFHKQACGLNRKSMKFKWFQSYCHLILNNMCSVYRGSLRYDHIDSRHCLTYVMFSRSGCPSVCPDVFEPVCAVSGFDNHVTLFKNSCFYERANCDGIFEEYEEVKMEVCRYVIEYLE